MLKKASHIVLVLFAVFLIEGCGKDSCNVVPDRVINVGFSRATNNNAFAHGGFDYLDGGVGGLIVYNMGTQDNPKFIAYDRLSTVNPGEGNRVSVEGFVIKDPVSGAKWLLQDGSPADIAECPLKPYRVTQSGLVFYVQH